MDETRLKLFCRELSSGARRTGRLSINGRRMKLELFCFDEYFDIQTDQPIVLELSDGRTATLFDCVQAGTGITSHQGKKVYRGAVVPNIVLIGHEPWGPSTLVRSATFGFHKSETALLTAGIIDHQYEKVIASSETSSTTNASSRYRETVTINHDKTSILKASSQGLEIHVWAGMSSSSGPMTHTVEFRPMVSLDFDPGVPVHEYISIVCDIVSLFAMSMGYASQPFNIQISPLTAAEQRLKIADDTFRGNFEARYAWAEQLPDLDHVWPGGAVLQVLKDSERTATEACLVAWMDRRHEWRTAYGLMMSALRRRERIDQDRLLNAFSWFESVPLDQKSKDFAQSEIDEISAAAINKAHELGLSGKDERIRRILGQLKAESASLRFKRLLKTLRERFGATLATLDRFEQDCLDAIPLRGKAAHGDFSMDDVSFSDFSRAIYAVECAAFLLMVRDLPISEAAQSRLHGHPLMDYVRAARWPQYF